MRSPACGSHIRCSKLEPLNEWARMHRARLAFARMSRNNITTLYAGIDLAKDTLRLGWYLLGFQPWKIGVPLEATGPRH